MMNYLRYIIQKFIIALKKNTGIIEKRPLRCTDQKLFFEQTWNWWIYPSQIHSCMYVSINHDYHAFIINKTVVPTKIIKKKYMSIVQEPQNDLVCLTTTNFVFYTMYMKLLILCLLNLKYYNFLFYILNIKMWYKYFIQVLFLE